MSAQGYAQFERPRPIAFWSAFERTGCPQRSQKIFRCSSFPIIVEKFLSVFLQKGFYIPTGFKSEFYIHNAAYLILRSNFLTLRK